MATVINNAMLEAILAEIRPLIGRGKVADYIPALASVSGDKLGIAISTVDGQHFAAGDAHERFSIQSISKVLSLVVAMNHYQEEEIWQRVGERSFRPAPLTRFCSWRSSRANRATRLSTPGHWWSATCCRAGSAPRVSGCWRLSAV